MVTQPRTRWTDREIEARLRDLAVDGVVPTARGLARCGHSDLANAMSRSGGSDAWADRLGLARAEHASRRGWRWEAWVAAYAEACGWSVERAIGVKSPFDLKINGHTVDVKSASGTEVEGALQFSWRIAREAHVVDFYVAIASRPERGPLVFVMPAAEVPLTMMTVREGSCGIRAAWRDRWDLLASRSGQ